MQDRQGVAQEAKFEPLLPNKPSQATQVSDLAFLFSCERGVAVPFGGSEVHVPFRSVLSDPFCKMNYQAMWKGGGVRNSQEIGLGKHDARVIHI